MYRTANGIMTSSISLVKYHNGINEDIEQGIDEDEE